MLFKIAWRNIWRNKRRSLIILTSVVIGIVMLVLTDCLSIGMIRQMLENRIGAHIGHLQIHRQGFRDDSVLKNYIPDSRKVEEALTDIPEIRTFSPRIIGFGLLSTAVNSSGVTIVGIDPQREPQITNIKKQVIQGRYLRLQPHEILLSEKLAQKLEVGIGDKVVMMVSTLQGNVGSELFHVVGIFRTFSSEFDRTHVYIPLPAAQALFGLGKKVNEFVVMAKDVSFVPRIQQALKNALGSHYEVLSYEDIIPMLVYQLKIYEEMILIYYLVIGLAIVFGIINTMLMAIFERIHELGVLMAIGMSQRRVFGMVLLEAALLAGVGTLAGVIIGIGVVWPLARTGIHLSMFSESLAHLGTGAIIYPILTPTAILNALLIVPAIVVLGSIYPAWKAIHFEPTQAMRYV